MVLDDVRIAFAEHGGPPTEFRRLPNGVVGRKDELEHSGRSISPARLTEAMGLVPCPAAFR